jgi:flagellar hook-associated protein 1 FlgK
MAGITSTLDIAKQALLTHQLSTQVASHNIANVDTPGYTKQSATLTTAQPSSSVYGTLGGGVKVEEIARHYDKFMTQRIMDQNSTLGNLEAQQQSLQVLETLFDETSGYGLNELMNQFWDSWQSLADSPESPVARQQVAQQGQTLSDHIQYMYTEMTNLRTEVTGNISTTVDQINTLTSEIASINQQIITSATQTRNANDLLDRRDERVKQVSQLVDVSYFTLSNGSYTVVLPNGHTLVEENTSNTLSWETIGAVTGLYWQGSSASKTFIDNSAALGGELGGFITIREQLDENDPNNYLGQLDNFANSLIREINQQHSQGVGLVPFSSTVVGTESTDATQSLLTYSYGSDIDTVAGSFDIWLYDTSGVLAPASVTVNLAGAVDLTDVVTAITAAAPPGLTASINNNRLQIATDGTRDYAFANDTSNFLQAAGINTFFSGYDSGTIAVNSDIVNNSDLLAAATVTATGDIFQGDNTNALTINTIRQDATVSFLDGTTSTLDGYYNGLVSDIGLNSKTVRWNYESGKLTLNSLNELRDTFSGVSLDEEMANLIKYQQAYTAAAKLISIVDEMMISLLNTI